MGRERERERERERGGGGSVIQSFTDDDYRQLFRDMMEKC